MSHSRDASASSDVSDEGSRQYCKAITHNIAKTDDDLMFIKGDLIQIVDKISDSSWLVIMHHHFFFLSFLFLLTRFPFFAGHLLRCGGNL